MSDLILTTFDWVPEIPRGYRRLDQPAVSRTEQLKEDL